MALTAQSDLFASVSEAGLNRLVAHVMRKRPSLFAYGTQFVAQHWEKLLCERPEVAPEVLAHQNPVVTVEDPLPIIGTGGAYALDFGLQLHSLKLDLHPQSAPLPPELDPLPEQRFSITARACAGLGCPDERTLDRFPPAPLPPFRPTDKEGKPGDRPPPGRDRPTVVLPAGELLCCCLELVVVGHFEVTGPPTDQVVEARLDGLEIVDIAPECLETNLECYLGLVLRYVVLPRLRIAVSALTLTIMDGLPAVHLSASTSVAPNPAVEDDQLKLFVDVEVGL